MVCGAYLKKHPNKSKPQIDTLVPNPMVLAEQYALTLPMAPGGEPSLTPQ